MCVESVDTEKVGADASSGSTASSYWLPAVKSLLSRFNEAAKKEEETHGSEEALPVILTKLVGEASDKLATVSDSLLAGLASATNSKTRKAIDATDGSEKSVVAWEFPTFPMIKQQDLASWSSIRKFWERAFFGKYSQNDAATYTDMDTSEDTETGVLDTAETGIEVQTAPADTHVCSDQNKAEEPAQFNVNEAAVVIDSGSNQEFELKAGLVAEEETDQQEDSPSALEKTQVDAAVDDEETNDMNSVKVAPTTVTQEEKAPDAMSKSSEERPEKSNLLENEEDVSPEPVTEPVVTSDEDAP